jgi:SSS family solute:Na+ symporter
MTPLLTALLVYALGLVALGAWFARHGASSESFFVSNRAMGGSLLAATLLAANLGASATVGATGFAYVNGPAAWWWSGSAGLGSLVLAFVVGPRLWRIARERQLLTVGDFLAYRFDARTRTFAGIVIWLGGFVILSGQIIGAGRVLQAAGHLSLPAGCLLATLVMAAYFVTGGLRSAAAVNVVQLAIKVIGFALAAPVAVAIVGGLDRAIAAHPAGTQWLTSADPRNGWTALFLTAPAFLISPGILQKVYGARDESAVRRGVGWNAVGLLLFAFLPVICGLAARVLFPGLEGRETEQALPRLMAEALPAWLSALALAAVFSAEMSAGDAVLFMLSTAGARDLYRGVLRPSATDREVVRAARVLAVAAAVIGFALTFYFETVVNALSLFYSLLGATLTAPIVFGLFGGGWFPADRRAALASMVVGVAVTLITWSAGFHYAWMSSPFFGLVANVMTYVLLAPLFGRTQTPRRR